MSVSVFDPTRCTLGEGALWHPEREQLFWFDILEHRLMTREGDRTRHWQFDEHVSAAGWIDHDRLLIASETALFTFDLRDNSRRDLVALEADKPENRSNDGRADPQGGFWIGTMGKNAENGSGAIYRFYRGELRKLRSVLTITNSICFSPDGTQVYFADTASQTVWRQGLDADGWPVGEPARFLDLKAQGLDPDGAVTDAEGRFWCAHWGAGEVTCYGTNGKRLSSFAVPARQPTCPAFGGPGLTRLFLTSAAVGLDGADDGKTFVIDADGLHGLPAPQVRL